MSWARRCRPRRHETRRFDGDVLQRRETLGWHADRLGKVRAPRDEGIVASNVPRSRMDHRSDPRGTQLGRAATGRPPWWTTAMPNPDNGPSRTTAPDSASPPPSLPHGNRRLHRLLTQPSAGLHGHGRHPRARRPRLREPPRPRAQIEIGPPQRRGDEETASSNFRSWPRRQDDGRRRRRWKSQEAVCDLAT